MRSDTGRGRTWIRATATPVARTVRLRTALAVLTVGAVLTGGAQTALAAPAPAVAYQPGDSGRTASQTYLLRARPAALTAALDAVAGAGGVVLRRVDVLDTAVVTLSAEQAVVLSRARDVLALTPDSSARLTGTTTTTTPGGYDPVADPGSLFNVGYLTQARSAWGKATGKGIDIALIDSGVSPVAGLSTPGKVVQGPDLTPESQNPATRSLDTFGHGTHMASIMAGLDAGVTATTAANNTSALLGVAPDARLVSVKVADAHGNTDVSQIIAGIGWVVQHARDPGFNIRVMNLSFGTDSLQAYQLDPLAHAVEVAWRSGIVVVTSAGNSGSANGRLTMPAADPFVLAVGANDLRQTKSTADDVIPAFSSLGDGVRNPDLVAPGSSVQGLRVPGSYIDDQFSATGKINDRFFRGSGTSQAAAATSGAVAMLLQARPTLTPDQVKALLRASAFPLPAANVQAQGAGLLQISKAMSLAVPAGATQIWPRSTGTGSLNASRGSAQLLLDGTMLNTEVDLFGRPYDSTTMAAALDARTSWNGGTWNASTWTGNAWSGTAWAASSWTGSAWSGRTWAGRTWATGTWDGRTWAGSNWSGTGWSGSTWAGRTWAGRTWADSDWR